jgi:hypothetical protein
VTSVSDSSETNLNPVHEFGERDVSLLSEDIKSLVIIAGSVLKPEAEEVTVFRRSTSPELNSEERRVVGFNRCEQVHPDTNKHALTNSGKLRVLVGNIKHMEERDEGLVRSCDKEHLKRVIVHGDTLQSAHNGMENGTTSD